MTTLSDLASAQQWVAWCPGQRGDKVTKVPYCSTWRRAESNDPATWITRAQAHLLAPRIGNGLGVGGVGIMLGKCGDLWLAGIDFDACRDPQTGSIEPWAAT